MKTNFCLKSNPSATFISCATQCNLQAVLNHHYTSFCFSQKSSFFFDSSGTSSGCLKAMPQSSLGIAIPGLVGLCLWLGVPLFSVPPLCVCLAPIDCFGDHLLECSHGPTRNSRHDALVDIACHALSQSHPDVLKEQQVSDEAPW